MSNTRATRNLITARHLWNPGSSSFPGDLVGPDTCMVNDFTWAMLADMGTWRPPAYTLHDLCNNSQSGASGVGGRALSLPVARPRTSVARSHPITSQINLRTCLTLLCYRPWELYLLSLTLSLSLHHSVMLLSTPTRFVVRSNVFRWFIVVCPHFT